MLTGNGIRNRLDGRGGDDTLTGRGGDDTLLGRSGADDLDGGPGNDQLRGSSGNDLLIGGSDDDRVVGNAGADEASFVGARRGVTADLVTHTASGEGDDRLIGIENLTGSRFGDDLAGDASANRLRGAGGDDVLRGRRGPDTLVGGSGFDIAEGAGGSDVCSAERYTGCLPGLLLTEVAAVGGPLLATSPAGDDRLFLVDQRSLIEILDQGSLTADPLLDIRDLVGFGGEQSLLGMAFHPSFSENGRLFVHYTDNSGDSVIAEFVADPTDRARIDPDSGRTILEVDQPAGNHNGGMLAFAPDGTLYIALGDGGGGGDPFGNGRDPSTLLGAMLRIDVDGAEPYAIPPDNPFVAGGGAAEVWAYGLRNPWRFSLDPLSGLMFIGDVGQDAREEVDIVPIGRPGVDFGWNELEGSACFSPSVNCDPAGTTLPALEYSHADGCSVIGGFVYRGKRIPELFGRYIYGDLCGGWVRSFRFVSDTVTERREWLTGVGAITSFGIDADGEVYVMTAAGPVYRLDPVR